MSMKEDYQNYCERRAEFEKNPLSKYWTEQNACSEMCIMWVTAGCVYT